MKILLKHNPAIFLREAVVRLSFKGFQGISEHKSAALKWVSATTFYLVKTVVPAG